MIHISAAEVNKRLKDLQQPQQPTLSDRLEAIREEAICAIEQAAEKGTIELLPEDIFDANSCWIKRIINAGIPAKQLLEVEVFSGDEENHYFNYTSDLLALRTDTLVQIAEFLAKS